LYVNNYWLLEAAQKSLIQNINSMNIKIIFLTVALAASTILCAQEKKAAPQKAAVPQSSAGACYADKKWKLQKVEKFGVENPPKEEQKNDFLMLKGDNTFTIMYNGIDKFGTYTKGGILQLKMADGGETWPFKILSCDGSTLKVDYRDGDTHNHLTYNAQ
jgi:hypothetical protein